MNASNLQTHEIVIYSNRKRLTGVTSVVVLAFLYMIGKDVYEFDTGVYVFTLLWLINIIAAGWLLFILLLRLRLRGPTITINSQGFSFPVPVRFTFLPQSRQSFIPWEEIEWIASSRTGMFTWLSLSLKDPAHYWSLYGKGPFRTWRRDMNGAHLNINQYFLCSNKCSQTYARMRTTTSFVVAASFPTASMPGHLWSYIGSTAKLTSLSEPIPVTA